jgi:hypothetical protein
LQENRVRNSWRPFSILEIIFLHYVARSFCESFKLPIEMPKIAKCLKCLIRRRRTIDFIFLRIKNKLCNYIHLLISYFSCRKYQTLIIKTERSDTIILVRQFLGGLGILAHFRHFRYFSGLSGLGPRKQINPSATADLSFGPPSALHQKSHIDNMLPLARLEGKQKSSSIYAYLFPRPLINKPRESRAAFPLAQR